MSRDDEWGARDADAAALERRLDTLRDEIDAAKRESGPRGGLSAVDVAAVLGAFSVSLVAALKIEDPNRVLVALTGELEALARDGNRDHPANRTISLIAQFIEASSPDE